MTQDLPLPARFYSPDETPDICRLLSAAGLHNLAEFVTNLQEELAEATEQHRVAQEESEGFEWDAKEAEEKNAKYKKVRESLEKRLETLSKSKDTKEHRDLLESVAEALEFIE